MCVQVPSSLSTGSTSATVASSPPIMIASVPASAAGGPPETGASTQPMPVSATSRAANSRVIATSMVE